MIYTIGQEPWYAGSQMSMSPCRSVISETMSERDNLPDKLFECAAEVVVVEEGRALVHIQQGSKVSRGRGGD